jgi:hypothetical protein
MNDEKPSTEAEQTKPGDLTASIERMIADLETIESIIRTTRLLAEGMENGGLKWATLSKALGEIRHIIGPCAIMPDACFHKVYDYASGTGAFHTPKEIIDFVTANPPLGAVKDAPTPIDPTAPEMLQGLGQVWKAIGTDTCGIRRANGTVRAWVIRENAGVEVFAKQSFKDGKPEPCWTFSGTVDCEKVIFGGIIGGRNKANQIVRFIRNGLLASRLRLKHKRMNKKVREVDSGRPDLTVIDDPGTGKGDPSHE